MQSWSRRPAQSARSLGAIDERSELVTVIRAQVQTGSYQPMPDQVLEQVAAWFLDTGRSARAESRSVSSTYTQHH
jgi:hypothetical protein